MPKVEWFDKGEDGPSKDPLVLLAIAGLMLALTGFYIEVEYEQKIGTFLWAVGFLMVGVSIGGARKR